LVGLHFILSALLAVVLRGNIVASAIGTIVGNPWTFPIIWAGSYRLGALLLGSNEIVIRTDVGNILAGVIQAVRAADAGSFVETVWPIWWPMMIGAFPLALLVGLLTYGLLMRALMIPRS
jgi:uncharacterized protein (DUF2062 family)